MPAETLLVVNPKSRAGRSARHLAALRAGVEAALGELEVALTRGPRDAERIAREGVRAGCRRVVVAGGDGTVSEVVTGILGADLGRYAELAVLPFGTGGDLPRTLGIPRDLGAALAALARGKRRVVDAGRVDYRTAEGTPRSSYFLNVASAGVSGLVDQLVARGGKGLGGRIAFLLATVRALVAYRAAPVEARLDGRSLGRGGLVLAAAANGRYFGGGMQVAPEARPDDGALDAVFIADRSKLFLLRNLPRIYRGTHLAVEGVASGRGGILELEPLLVEGARGEPPRIPVDVDGEPLGYLPARFEVVPRALTLFGLLG